MPRYFFDTPGFEPEIDETGTEFADDEAARQAAREMLPGLLTDFLAAGRDEQEFVLMIRRENREAVYAVTLALAEVRFKAQFHRPEMQLRASALN